MKERYIRDIIGGFPYPISSMFMKLRTDECLDPGPLRLKYIFSTGEAIARFLGMVTLCECREFLEKAGVALPTALTNEFSRSFGRPSWGTWVQYGREGSKWLAANQAEPLMPELEGFYFKKAPAESAALQSLGRLLTIRNQLTHEKLKAMLVVEFKSLCDETFPLLEEVLEALDFLLDYTLYFVSGIEVNKRRRRDPDFWHRYKRITGNSDAFEGDRDTLQYVMDSKAILLANTETRRHLSLDPLLVYEEFKDKPKDIFFFNGLAKPGVAEYAPCNHGKLFTSSESARAEDIALELVQLLALFKAPDAPNLPSDQPGGGENHGQ